MHNYTTPPDILAKVQRRLGRRFANESIDPARAALVVIDMQNYYVAEGFPSGLAQAREAVAAINRMAAAMRAAGGRVSGCSPARPGRWSSGPSTTDTACRPRAPRGG